MPWLLYALIDALIAGVLLWIAWLIVKWIIRRANGSETVSMVADVLFGIVALILVLSIMTGNLHVYMVR